jgi:hypothetical protein
MLITDLISPLIARVASLANTARETRRSMVYAGTTGPSEEGSSIDERAEPVSLGGGGGTSGAGVTFAIGGGVGAGVLRDDPKSDAKGLRRLVADWGGGLGGRFCCAAAVPGRAGKGGG